MKLHRYEWLHLEITRHLLSLSSYFSMSENIQSTVLGASLFNSSMQIPEVYKPLQDHSEKAKRNTAPTYNFRTILETPLPTRSSCPKTVFSPSAEQFHLPYRNWYWHSLIPICAPSPITMMASGRLWQIARCRGARPGILLQMILAPKATTDDKALKKEKKKAERHVITKLRPLIAFAMCCCMAVKTLGKRERVGSWVPRIMQTYPNLSGLANEVGNLAVIPDLICARNNKQMEFWHFRFHSYTQPSADEMWEARHVQKKNSDNWLFTNLWSSCLLWMAYINSGLAFQLLQPVHPSHMWNPWAQFGDWLHATYPLACYYIQGIEWLIKVH